MQQSVQVNGDTVSAIETDSPTISGTFTSDDATNLPVNTRASFSGTSAASILGTLPGVQDDASGISVQGALPFQVEVTVDGITVKSPAGGSFIGDAFPSTESISEIRADGVLAGAEFGDPGAGRRHHQGRRQRTSTAPASGTTRTPPSMPSPTPTPPPPPRPARPATPSAAASAVPCLLPHYNGHNRSFFFGDYEGWRHPAQTTLNEVVPSTLMKQGDFSKYVVPDGEGGNAFTGINNPTTGAALRQQSGHQRQHRSP